MLFSLLGRFMPCESKMNNLKFDEAWTKQIIRIFEVLLYMLIIGSLWSQGSLTQLRGEFV